MPELVEVLLQILVALVSSVASAFLGYLFSSSRYKTKGLRELKELAGLKNLLDKGSPEHEQLNLFIRQDIEKLDTERQKTREPFGFGLAIAFILLGIATGMPAITFGGSWLFLLFATAFFFLFGTVGLLTDGRKVVRDSNGKEKK